MNRTAQVTSLLNQLNQLTERRQELNKEKSICDELIANKQHEYRIQSAARVIEFILSEYRQGRLVNLDIMLVHCLNKLNGNIDGVELPLNEKGKPIAMFPLATSSKAE